MPWLGSDSGKLSESLGVCCALLVCLATGPCQSLWASHTEWPSYQFDPQHTAFNSQDSVRFPLEEAWRVSLGADPLGLRVSLRVTLNPKSRSRG